MADPDGPPRGIADPDRRPVRRRRMFYVPGYDPFPPRRYRELYRREGAAQAALSGHELTLSARPGEAFGWRVEAVIEGAPAATVVEVLVWSDIVRRSMSSGILATYAQLARTAWIYLSTGALWRLMRLRKGPILAALYPVAMLLAQLALALAAGLLVAGLVRRLPGGLPGAALAPVLCLAVAALALRWFRARDGALFAYYLMHDYAFAAGGRGADPPALAARIAAFADRVAAALASDVDEVLVVGHSSGAQIAVAALADVLRRSPAQTPAHAQTPARTPALSFLSLGQVIPMVSFLPDAHALRADLALLSRSDALTWVDVSAPGDGCAFALCDPVAVTGLGQGRWPLILSAAFTRTLRPETWAALRWRFFRLHFQYQCAFDNLPDGDGAYDYFATTAGPRTLSARFASRRPSAQAITRAVSAYRSTAA